MKKGLIAVWSAMFFVAMAFVSAGFSEEADAKAGKAVYDKNKCGVCHGKDGKGTKMGPAVAGKKQDKKLKDAVLKGVKPKMPAYEKKFKKGDMENLLKYLEELGGEKK